MHTSFGFVATLMLVRVEALTGAYRDWARYAAAVAFVLSLSVLHELFEYAGALLLGEGEGVLFIGAGNTDPWDTQKDMLNNLVGSLIGVGTLMLTEGEGSQPNPPA